jgi:glycosyltransferase involved in cell wall biosynthesis
VRVLIAHNSYQQRGGEDAVVEAEVALLRARGHAVEVYSRHNDELREMGAGAAARDTIWSARTIREVEQLIDSFGPDLIHVHNTFALISPAIAAVAAKRGTPVVQTLHNFRLLCLQAALLRDGRVCEDCVGRIPWRGVVHRCYRGSASQSAVLAVMLGVHRALGTYRRHVARYIALSEFSRARFAAGGLPEQRIVVKPNFVDIPPPSDGPRSGALFVGRLSPEKGTRVLAAVGVTARARPIDVIGVGPDQACLEGLPGVRLLGWQPPASVYARMREASYLIAPSICYENFPLAIMEAFAHSMPVIASRLGAMAELVDAGTTGLLFEPGDARDLAAVMAWAESHPAEMRAMGRAARREYEAKYTPDRNYGTLMGIYRDAMSVPQG